MSKVNQITRTNEPCGYWDNNLKYIKRDKIYTNSTRTCTFNLLTTEACSYRWWVFVKKIDGLTVFNNYRYSVTTARHQRKIRNLLKELKIKIDLEVTTKLSLSNYYNINTLIEDSEIEVCDDFLQRELNKQRNYQLKRNIFLQNKLHLETLLEQGYQFRDYKIKDSKLFGKINAVGVHQRVNINNPSFDVENALNDFYKDGFSQVIFYI